MYVHQCSERVAVQKVCAGHLQHGGAGVLLAGGEGWGTQPVDGRSSEEDSHKFSINFSSGGSSK